MGQQNIDRIKAKFGWTYEDEDVDDCVELIDKVYYDNLIYCEEYNDDRDSTTWFFEDGSRVELTTEELYLYLLIVEHLELDQEEMFI